MTLITAWCCWFKYSLYGVLLEQSDTDGNVLLSLVCVFRVFRAFAAFVL